tara:strand:- start:1281 stop:1541 length:261 start_codon:yes stop_codon:yes gene_type:complete
MYGLAGQVHGVQTLHLERELTEIAYQGLMRRGRIDSTKKMKDESHFLQPLLEITKERKTSADKLLESYKNKWNKSLEPIHVSGKLV